MKLTIEPEWTFTPDWRGNLELPEEEQVRIDMRLLTNRESLGAKGAEDVGAKAVNAIRNLEINGQVIDTWDKLLDCSLPDLQLQIMQQINQRAVSDSKNF